MSQENVEIVRDFFGDQGRFFDKTVAAIDFFGDFRKQVFTDA